MNDLVKFSQISRIEMGGSMAGEQLGDPGTGSGSVGDLGRGGRGGGAGLDYCNSASSLTSL